MEPVLVAVWRILLIHIGLSTQYQDQLHLDTAIYKSPRHYLSSMLWTRTSLQTMVHNPVNNNKQKLKAVDIVLSVISTIQKLSTLLIHSGRVHIRK